MYGKPNGRVEIKSRMSEWFPSNVGLREEGVINFALLNPKIELLRRNISKSAIEASW